MSKISYPTITRIHARNFRSLADITVDLNPLTILVGPNGSGKSNVVDVLRFLRDILLRGLDTAIMDRNGMSAIRRWSPKGKPFDVHIELFFSLLEAEGKYAFTLGSESRAEYRVKSEVLCIKSNNKKLIDLEIKNNELIKPENLIERLNPKNYFTKELNDLQLLRLARMMDTENNYKIITQVNRLFSNMGFYTIFPNNLREPQKSANPFPLDENGQNLASVLRHIKNSGKGNLYDHIVFALTKVVPDLDDISVTQVGGYYVTRLHYKADSVKGRRPSFELSQESDGTLRMLGILTSLYQIPPKPLLAIEEPELTIHPGALGVLCDEIQDASLRSQIIITTHSPELVSQFPADAFRAVEKVKGITHIGEISANQRRAINQKLFSPGEIMRIEGFLREE